VIREDLRCMRQDVDADADRLDLRRRFEHPAGDPAARELQRGGQPADSRADNQDVLHLTSLLPRGLSLTRHRCDFARRVEATMRLKAVLVLANVRVLPRGASGAAASLMRRSMGC
jgi:hypothetical protein